MPDPSTSTFSPRYDECDPDGQLRAANYVRFALQAAIEAGAAADLNTAGLEAGGWLEHVGDIGLQIVQPVVFGDKLEVQTRVTRHGPPVWRREFVFKRAETTLAVAFVDVFDEAESQAGADDDAEVAPDDNPAWDGLVSEPPEPPGRAFRAVWRAGWQHLDISGQLDPAWLTQMLGDMESRAAEARGWSDERTQQTGISWQVIEHRLELFDPIRSGDVLNIISYIGEAGDDQMVRHALIERQDAGLVVQVARARTRWACLSTATTERCPIPDDWLYDLSEQTVEQ